MSTEHAGNTELASAARHREQTVADRIMRDREFAGIENELFCEPRTSMLFGDAKASVGHLVSEVRAA